MGKMNVLQDIHYVPIRVYTQDTSTFSTPCINMKLAEHVEFIIHFGAIATDGFTLTVCQSTATTMTSGDAIACRYRLSAADGTDTMGATTALETTGLDIVETGTYDLMTLIVDVDSSDCVNESHPYVGLTFTDPGSADQISQIEALVWPKYPQETNAGYLT
jgi:hypothetical protein